MAEKRIDLSIIIISFNTRQLLKSCLISLFQITDKLFFEVIVVDNNSQDGSVELVKKEFPQVKLIANKDNLGFGRANNQGLKEARGKMILFLNSDTIVHSRALEELTHFLKFNPKVGVVGPKLLNRDGTDQASAGSFPYLGICAIMLFAEHFWPNRLVRGSGAQIRLVDWVMGAAMVFRKEVLDQVGGFDENIFMYLEEVELCYRVKKAGWQIAFFPEAVITHFGQGSSQSGRKGPILGIYKGLAYFYRKHRPGWEGRFLKLMLKIKAGSAYLLGSLTKNDYLKETYGQAFRLV
ncbi:MAG: glycosyltransferase family 2 protein [Candidatus Pacebacteria bacterium]|nr:glycosyltransferase family 2 protein [Candidatus Paceibacterota bacterium]